MKQWGLDDRTHVLYNPCNYVIMELWDRLMELLRMKRAPGPRYFKLDEDLHTALVDRADRESRPAGDIQEELVAAGLAQLQTSDELKARWETLSQIFTGDT